MKPSLMNWFSKVCVGGMCRCVWVCGCDAWVGKGGCLVVAVVVGMGMSVGVVYAPYLDSVKIL